MKEKREKKTRATYRFKSKLQVEQCGRQHTHSAYVCYAFIESLNPSYIIQQHIYLSLHWKLCNLMHAPHPFEKRSNDCTSSSHNSCIIIIQWSNVYVRPSAAGINNNNNNNRQCNQKPHDFQYIFGSLSLSHSIL